MDVLLILFLIVLNGVFALSEMSIVSARKARLQQLSDEGSTGAAAALQLANEPSHFLSSVQIGITLIGITSGALGEATLSEELTVWLKQWPQLEAHAQELALGLVVAGVTIASLIFGELLPKRLALVNPEPIASVMARPMMWLARATYPIARLLSYITDALLKLLRVHGRSSPPVSEEEIKVLMEQGAEAGVFQEHEQAMVSRVFRLDELKVTGVMTPRTDVVALDLDLPLEQNLRRISDSAHSRFPVVHGDLDNVAGIVQAKHLLEDFVLGHPVDLTSRLAKPLFVPVTLTVTQVIQQFKKHRQTLALVIDEYGNLQGIATLNDVMEALVGNIATVEDERDLDVIRRDDGSWLIDGSVTIERFKDVLEIDETLPDEEEGVYQTVGGFAMAQLGKIPKAGDKFQWSGIELEVMDMDKRRVDKLLVKRVAPLAREMSDDG